MSSAVAWEEAGSFALRMEQRTRPMMILYSMYSLEIWTVSLQCGPVQCFQHAVDTGGVSISAKYEAGCSSLQSTITQTQCADALDYRSMEPIVSG